MTNVSASPERAEADTYPPAAPTKPLAWAAEASGLEACMSNCPVLMISVCAPIRAAPGSVAAGAVVVAGPRSLPPAEVNGTGWAGAAMLEAEEQAAKLKPTRTTKGRMARLLFVTFIEPLLRADRDGQPSSTTDAMYVSRVPSKVHSGGGGV